MRVLPEPVGPRNNRLPTGRPGEFNPAQNTWYKSTSDCTPSSWPTIFDRRDPSKSRVSLLRMLGLSCWRTADLITRPLAGRAPQMARRLTKLLQGRSCRNETTLSSERSATEPTRSQQHTKFQFVECVSPSETGFHPDAK